MVFKIRIISDDAEVIEKFSNQFVTETNEKSKGSVSVSAKITSPKRVVLTMRYRGLGESVFKRVVLPEMQKTIWSKDENARVEFIEKRKKKKPSLKERLLGKRSEDKPKKANKKAKQTS